MQDLFYLNLKPFLLSDLEILTEYQMAMEKMTLCKFYF